MGKRDSKAAKKKREERRGETRVHADAKASKSESKRDKKEANQKDEEDLDALLAEFKAMQTDTKSVSEKLVPPPSPRANSSLTAHPHKDELLLYGGEIYDGKKNTFYSELFRYSVKKNEWKQILAPNTPPPRSSHQAAAVPSSGGSLFVFGGEFSSSNQSQFHHYRDFWCLDLTTNTWEQVTAKNGPSARSGHRMAHVRDTLLVFGGFFDNLRDVKYYNDLHLFDLSLYKWTKVSVEPGAQVPSPRSGFQLCVDPAGGAEGAGLLLLYGGYFKKQVKMQQFDSHKEKSQVEELSDTGVEYRDLWAFDLGTKQWDTLKKSGIPPSSRSGFGMVLHKRRLIVFGGVHDEDTPDGEGLISTFYDDLHAYNLDAGKWHELTVTASKRGAAARTAPSESESGSKSGKKDGNDEDLEDDLLLDGGGRRRNRNRTDGDDEEAAGKTAKGKAKAVDVSDEAQSDPVATKDGDANSASATRDATDDTPAPEAKQAAAPVPCARMKANLALRGNTLYAHGGIVEPEEAQELTLNDFWTLDLSKLDGWTCLYEGEDREKALVVEKDDEEDDGDEEGDSSDTDGSEDEDGDESSSEEEQVAATIGGVKLS